MSEAITLLDPLLASQRKRKKREGFGKVTLLEYRIATSSKNKDVERMGYDNGGPDLGGMGEGGITSCSTCRPSTTGASSARISYAFLWNSSCAAMRSARLRRGSGVSRTCVCGVSC